MTAAHSESELLAHWHFTNEQWREFLYYEKLEFESQSFLDLRQVLMGGSLIILIIAFFGAVKGGFGVFMLILIMGISLIGFCYFLRRLVRQSNERRLQTLTGNVKISTTSVSLNGVIFSWGKGWSRPEIYKDYIYIGEAKMPVLYFTSVRWIAVKGGREKIEKKCLVPVQPGKESEADFVITEITENYFKFKK